MGAQASVSRWSGPSLVLPSLHAANDSGDISSLAFLLRCSFKAKKKEEEKVEEENEIAAAKTERDKEFEKFYSQISSMSSLSDAEGAWTEL